MLREKLRPILRILLVLVASALLTACALRAMFGNVIIVEDIENEVNEIITTVFSDSTAAVCLSTQYGFYECTYIIDGEIITSTLYLLSEYGITGVLIDPVILQVPSGVTDISATYDEGSGPQPLVKTLTGAFDVTPDIRVSAEIGQKFIILELPSSVTENLPPGDPNSAPEIEYSLVYTLEQPISVPVSPMNVKVMLAGKVTVRGHKYYVPTLPCVTDFASIPPLEIPVSNTPVDLQPAVGDLIAQGGNVECNNQQYTYFTVPPPPKLMYLPLLYRMD